MSKKCELCGIVTMNDGVLCNDCHALYNNKIIDRCDKCGEWYVLSEGCCSEEKCPICGAFSGDGLCGDCSVNISVYVREIKIKAQLMSQEEFLDYFEVWRSNAAHNINSEEDYIKNCLKLYAFAIIVKEFYNDAVLLEDFNVLKDGFNVDASVAADTDAKTVDDKLLNYEYERELLTKEYKCKNEIHVKFLAEKVIADWLFDYNIEFEYEKSVRLLDFYEHCVTFYLPDFDIYLDYLGTFAEKYISDIGLLDSYMEGISIFYLTKNDLKDLEKSMKNILEFEY